MSHFTVLVVTNTPDGVDDVLAPFNEQDEQYMEFIDDHDEQVQEFGKDDTFYQDADGKLHLRWDYPKEWDIEITKEEYNEHVEKHGRGAVDKKGFPGLDGQQCTKRVLPEGAKEVSLPMSMYAGQQGWDFDTWVTEWSGRTKEDNMIDGRWGYKSNSDAKWDWYQIGGRWQGELAVKEGATSGVTGEKSLLSDDRELKGFDQCQVKDLDLDVMYKKRIQEREKWWEQAQAEEKDDPTLLHIKYNIKPGTTKEEYINSGDQFSTFAVLMDGEWYERGTMGWWGCVSDEKDDWNEQFAKLFNNLDGEKYITVVDCHIEGGCYDRLQYQS